MRARGRVGGESLLVAAVLLHAGSWFAMLGSDRTWVDSWKDALDWAAGSVIIVGPLLASLAAWTYSSWSRTSMPDLVVSAPNIVRGWYGPALRLYLVCVASFGLLVVEVTGYALVSGLPIAPHQFVVLPLCLLMFGVHLLLGVSLGLRLPPRFAGVAAGPLSFLLFILATQGRAPAVFDTGGAGSLTGMQYRISDLVLLTALAAALVIAALPLSLWREISPGRTLFCGVAVVAVVSAFLVRGPDIEERLESSGAEYVCAGANPQACIAAEAPRRLATVARELDRLARPLVELGVELPSTWKQSLPGKPADPAVGSLSVSSGRHSAPLDLDLVRSLSHPGTCAFEAETSSSTSARDRLARWIAYRNQVGDPPHDKAWFDSTASDDWVRRVYPLLRSCELRGVPHP